jgi:hypothetical protein
MEPSLTTLVADELAVPVDPRIGAMAAAIAARYPAAARAVLFYGSCLRERQLEGLMIDFYLIVSDYRAAYGRSWLAPANRLIPPNVFPFLHEGLTAKYAVLSEDHFARECGRAARSASVFARFAQPSRLVWSADARAAAKVVSAVSQAPETLLHFTSLQADEQEANDPLALWRKAFTLTYRAEFRAERGGRPVDIVDADPARYRRFAAAAGFPGGNALPPDERRLFAAVWRHFERRGRRATLLRLVKASFTFAGGVDYLAWKINRHAGTKIAVQPWQRRWPLLAGLILLPRLLKRGAIR